MKVAFLYLLFSFAIWGCHPNGPANTQETTMKTKEFTESDACKALLRDLKIRADSELGKSLLAEQFVREPYSGNCIIETDVEQFSFNLKTMSFKIVQGRNPLGHPHVIRGEFFISDTGQLKARFCGEDG